MMPTTIQPVATPSRNENEGGRDGEPAKATRSKRRSASWEEGRGGTKGAGGTAHDRSDEDPDPTGGEHESGGGGGGGESRLEVNVPWSTSSSSSSSTDPESGGLYVTAADGYARLSTCLRSVLFHPAGLPLVRFFNNDNDDDPANNMYSKDSFAHFPSDERGGGAGGSTGFDKVLEDGYAAYQAKVHAYVEQKAQSKDPDLEIARPSDETLAGILHDGISRELPSTLEASHRHRLWSNLNFASEARTGLLVRRNDDHDKSGIVLLLEVGWGGADVEMWWKKADRNAQYLDLFQYPINKSSDATFSGPLLFAVLTLDTDKADLDDRSRESAQLGVFLCVPRQPLPVVVEAEDGPLPGYRAALLYRDTFTTLADASKGMGRTLRATVALAQMLTDPGRRVIKGFVSLGPNCCRIGDKVLRAYDSRFRRTERRPDVYGDPDIAPGARVLCRIVDKKMAVELPPHDKWLTFQLWDRRARIYDPWEKRKWLWQLGGELLVMETDFHEGRHYAVSPKEFIPVVAFLQMMHAKGFVHGDIRCANIVFGKGLIDFDLGGRVEDAPTYPDGYEQDLVDGSRRGISGKTITKSDDWYAMLRAILVVHKLYPPAPPSDSDLNLTFSRDGFIRLTEPSTAVPGTGALDDSMILNLASDLIKFLRKVDSWTISAPESFLSVVVLWGGVPEQ